MTGVLNVTDILQWVTNHFNDGSLSQQSLVNKRHQHVFHVFPELGYQLNPWLEKQVKAFLRERHLISKELAKQRFDPLWHRGSVIDVSRCELNGEELATVIDPKMKLETIEPADRVLSAKSGFGKDTIGVNPTMMTHCNGN